MDVVRTNFLSLLPQIRSEIDECDFVAIDTEFSGLGQNRNYNLFDTLEDRYIKIKDSCKDHCVMQIGLSCFTKAKEKDDFSFDCKCYNFFVFPYKVQNTPRLPDKCYVFQPSAFHFLAGHNFDFNKWVREGISYMSIPEETVLMEWIQKNKGEDGTPKVGQEKPPELSKASISIQEEHKEFIEKFIDDLDKFIKDSTAEKLDLEPCSSYRRKLIYETTRNLQINGLKLSTCVVSEHSSERFISVAKISAEQKQKEEEDLINEAVGFSRVIQHLIQSRKAVIGHNLLIDIAHIIRHFIQPLDENISEFKATIRDVFPSIFDTKIIATDPNLKELITNTALNDLYQRLQKEPFKKVEVTITNKTDDGNSNASYHQAGYDAFITGSCFINMIHHLHPKAKSIPFNALEKYNGKMHLIYSFDFPYLDITKEQIVSSRDNVFHLTFPPEWKTVDLHQLFSPFGPIQIGWIDDTSALVAIKDENRAIDVEKNIKNSSTSLFTIQSYQKYQKLETAKSASPDSKRGLTDDNKELEDGEIINNSPLPPRKKKRVKSRNPPSRNR